MQLKRKPRIKVPQAFKYLHPEMPDTMPICDGKRGDSGENRSKKGGVGQLTDEQSSSQSNGI